MPPVADSGRDAEFAGAQVMTLSRWAREQAISDGRVYRLNFDESSQTYFVTAQVGGTFVRPEVEFGQLFEVPEGVVMAWAAPRISRAPVICPARSALGAVSPNTGASACIASTLGLRGTRRRDIVRRSYASMGASFTELWNESGGEEDRVVRTVQRWRAQGK